MATVNAEAGARVTEAVCGLSWVKECFCTGGGGGGDDGDGDGGGEMATGRMITDEAASGLEAATVRGGVRHVLNMARAS